MMTAKVEKYWSITITVTDIGTDTDSIIVADNKNGKMVPKDTR